MNNAAVSRMAERIADFYFSQDSFFGPLVFYGQKDAVSAALAYAEKKYRDAHPEDCVLRLSAEQFKREFLYFFCFDACHDDLRNYMKDLGAHDLLLIDGFDEFGGWVATQEEIYGIMDDLYEHGRRAVIGMSRPPRDIPSLEDRVRTQLEGGLIWSLSDSTDYTQR